MDNLDISDRLIEEGERFGRDEFLNRCAEEWPFTYLLDELDCSRERLRQLARDLRDLVMAGELTFRIDARHHQAAHVKAVR